MVVNSLPIQPHPIVSYWRVGRLLYASLILFAMESWLYWYLFERFVAKQNNLWATFWFCCFLFSFVHIFLVMMDGWSRYQNYKRAKDQFYEHGFNPRIANLYMGSKCQRMAAEVAAEELGMKDEIQEHFRKNGVKWYHFVPYFMVKDPLFLFRKSFWSRTFMEKRYTPKYNYRQLQANLSL